MAYWFAGGWFIWVSGISAWAAGVCLVGVFGSFGFVLWFAGFVLVWCGWFGCLLVFCVCWVFVGLLACDFVWVGRYSFYDFWLCGFWWLWFWYFGSMLVLWCLVILVVLRFCGAGCFLDFGCFFRLVGVLWFVLWFWVGVFCVSGGFCCFC